MILAPENPENPDALGQEIAQPVASTALAAGGEVVKQDPSPPAPAPSCAVPEWLHNAAQVVRVEVLRWALAAVDPWDTQLRNQSSETGFCFLLQSHGERQHGLAADWLEQC